VSNAEKAKPKGRARYNLELPSSIDDRLEKLAEQHQLTKSEIVRTAIKFFAAYESLERDGYKVAATKVDAEGNTDTVRYELI